MKYFLILISCLVITGCSAVKVEFVYPSIPELQEPPKVEDYNLQLIRINNTEYYALTEEDARILSENWILFRKWSETNFELLKTLKIEEQTYNKGKK